MRRSWRSGAARKRILLAAATHEKRKSDISCKHCFHAGHTVFTGFSGIVMIFSMHRCMYHEIHDAIRVRAMNGKADGVTSILFVHVPSSILSSLTATGSPNLLCSLSKMESVGWTNCSTFSEAKLCPSSSIFVDLVSTKNGKYSCDPISSTICRVRSSSSRLDFAAA
jgi:hypothetical protein